MRRALRVADLKFFRAGSTGSLGRAEEKNGTEAEGSGMEVQEGAWFSGEDREDA